MGTPTLQSEPAESWWLCSLLRNRSQSPRTQLEGPDNIKALKQVVPKRGLRGGKEEALFLGPSQEATGPCGPRGTEGLMLRSDTGPFKPFIG